MADNMETGRIQMLLFALIALAVCLACAQTDKPQTHVDRSHGVETSIPGTTIPNNAPLPTPSNRGQTAEPVGSYIYNQDGKVALQNEAGSIYTRPDGRTVLVGAGGQTIVTNPDDSDSSQDVDDDDFGPRGNVIINGGGSHGQSFFTGSSNGNGVFINSAGEGGYQSYNNHQVRIVNGGLQLTTGGQVYNFPAKGADANGKEKVNINGQEAVVEYQNGNIIVELADGTVLAKADGGLFSGDRQSFDNRKQIQANAAREAARVQEEVANLQKELGEQLNSQMRKLQEDLERSLGNIRF